MSKDNIIAAKAYIQLREEQEELKNLVKEFLEETTYVPFRAMDCDQDKVEELWEKLSNIVQEKNDLD